MPDMLGYTYFFSHVTEVRSPAGGSLWRTHVTLWGSSIQSRQSAVTDLQGTPLNHVLEQ